MQCTSVSMFGLEAAALYLYCDRGSVVTCYDGSLEMCGGGRWDTGNNDLFLQSSCRAVVPQVSIEEHCAKREVLSEGHVNARFYTTSPMLFSFSIIRHRYFVGSAHLFHYLTGIQLSVICYMPATSLPDSDPSRQPTIQFWY